jgi:hypothetical protein
MASMCLHPEKRKVKLLSEFHPPMAKYICIIIIIGGFVLFPPIGMVSAGVSINLSASCARCGDTPRASDAVPTAS